MADDFYRAFEERYRGPRELIKERLRVYLAFVEPLKGLHPDAFVVDLGCGRGEWLELMREVGVAARGVDLDEGMLAACRERGLPAEHAEAVTYLRGLPDASVAIVSAFHVAEHIPFADLQKLVQEALRVLQPGGLLILETPNPENLVVGTSSFYFDPTHQRPLPPRLLSFLPEHYGFERTAVLRLQEPQVPEAAVKLWDVLASASPDFAVVAQKGGTTPEHWALFDAAFATPHGLQLPELAERYDAAAHKRAQALSGALNARLEAQQERVEQLGQALKAQVTTLGGELGGRLDQQQERVEQLGEALKAHVATLAGELGERLEARQAQIQQLLERMATHTAAQADRAIAQLAARPDALAGANGALRSAHQAQVTALQAERDALRASLSWRITAPLRWAARPFMESASHADAPSPGTVPAPLRPLVTAMRRVLRDPQRSYRLNQRLMRYPSLHQWLVGLSKRAGIYPGAVATAATAATTSLVASPAPVGTPPATGAGIPGQPMHGEPTPALELTASARRIYQDLLDARAARKGV